MKNIPIGMENKMGVRAAIPINPYFFQMRIIRRLRALKIFFFGGGSFLYEGIVYLYGSVHIGDRFRKKRAGTEFTFEILPYPGKRGINPFAEVHKDSDAQHAPENGIQVRFQKGEVVFGIEIDNKRTESELDAADKYKDQDPEKFVHSAGFNWKTKVGKVKLGKPFQYVALKPVKFFRRKPGRRHRPGREQCMPAP
jgi:hypothetical protein